MKKFLALIVLLLVFIYVGQAQPPPPTPEPIPIDGGLFALLIGGVILGGREVYMHEKKKKKHKK